MVVAFGMRNNRHTNVIHANAATSVKTHDEADGWTYNRLERELF